MHEKKAKMKSTTMVIHSDIKIHKARKPAIAQGETDSQKGSR